MFFSCIATLTTLSVTEYVLKAFMQNVYSL